MKRPVLVFIVLTVLLNYIFPFSNIFALDSTGTCSNYEVAIVNSDGTVTNLACKDTYAEALTSMNAYASTEDHVATIFYNNEVIDTKYGLLYLRTKPSDDYNTYLYQTATTSTTYTYTNGYYGSDALYLGLNYDNLRAKMMISGFLGYVPKTESGYKAYQIIPISILKSVSHYTVEDGDLKHYLAKYLIESNSYIGYTEIGPSPSYLEEGKIYYSFDGHYFYEELTNLIDDYKNNSVEKSINFNDIYYNYYMYLPNHTSTNYSADDLDSYLKNVRGYIAKPNIKYDEDGKPIGYIYPTSGSQSAMYNEGSSFKESEEKFGVNALLTFGLAANESWWGRSSLSLSTKNLFGHNAIDGAESTYATTYDSEKYGIFSHADDYINFGYADYDDPRYYGGHYGNKQSGMNVKYASDPYWGEKMASYYYAVDKELGLKDYNSYTIGIKMDDTIVNLRTEPNTSSSIPYMLMNGYTNTKIANMPVVIVEEVTGEETLGSNIWYKIISDSLLDEDKVPYADPASGEPRPEFTLEEQYLYVHSSQIVKAGEYIQKQGEFYFNGLTYDDATNKLTISGFLGIKGINNPKSDTINYELTLVDQNDPEKEYSLSLSDWDTDVPFEIPLLDGYDYSGSWFKGEIDLGFVPEGNYSVYVKATSGPYQAVSELTNTFINDMTSKVTIDGRGYQFRINYYDKDMPVEMFIRDGGLISTSNLPTTDNKFITYTKLELANNSLNIKGTAFNVGIDYSASKEVARKIIFENIDTLEKIEYDLATITDGDYKVTLRVPDNKDKTKAWFEDNINLANLEVGTYAIYIKTTVDGITDYGELNDLFYRDMPAAITIDGKTYTLKLNSSKRNRIELTVK